MAPEIRPRVALFGGSFDPPHCGHLHAARTARKAFELDQVRFMPAARPPHKPDRILAAGTQRARMLELAIATAEPDLQRASLVDRRELERPGPSYTLLSVEELLAEAGGPEAVELFLILGSDNLQGLELWHEIERLLCLARPIVIQRGARAAELPAALSAKLSHGAMESLRAGLVALPPVNASSTEARGRVESGPELAPEVAAYIDRHGLYKRKL
ncbi:MAG: nicotinate (nicotinamide) nucleotide adenylyltransferase [bacterium]